MSHNVKRNLPNYCDSFTFAEMSFVLLLVLGGKSCQDADKLLLIVYMLIKTQLLCCFDMSKSDYNDEIWHNFNVFNYAQLSSRQRHENA